MSLRDKYTDEEWDAKLEIIASKPLTPNQCFTYERVNVLKDEDGYEYVIPFSMTETFLKMEQSVYLKGEYDEFEETFGKYRCGKDVFTEYEFYIKK